jgi:thioredoxin 1
MKQVTSEELKQLQLEGKKLLVDFYATWCGPCRQLMPKLESFENEFPNVDFVKIDVDQNMELAKNLAIRGVPTVIIFNGENLHDRSSGVQSDQYYKTLLTNI